jgi:ribosomal protein L11 methyltransferase
MAWLELRIDTTQEAIDWVNSSLAATPYTGDIAVTEYRGSGSDLEQNQPNWAYTVRLYLPNNRQAGRDLGTIERQLSSLQRTGMISELQVIELDNQPISEAAKNSATHRVGERFVIVSGNHSDLVNEADIAIELEKSFAFGSGLHPATILSLQLLEHYVHPSMNALDLGSGTGILSVAMAKLGAQVLAIDNDPISVQASQHAVALNQAEQRITVMQGSLGDGSVMGHWMGLQTLDRVPRIEAKDRFDLIVANVLGRIHIALAQDYRQALRRTSAQAGLLITSGFNTDYEDEVSFALAEAGLTAIDRRSMDEWVALVHQITDSSSPTSVIDVSSDQTPTGQPK